MCSKHLYIPLLTLVLAAGCTLDSQQRTSVTPPPPYWQSQNQQMRDQLSEMRVFHEKESEKMSDDLHVFRNYEIERLEAAGKQLQREQVAKQVPEQTPAKREKWSWFKKKDKDHVANTPQLTDTPQVSNRSNGTSNVR